MRVPFDVDGKNRDGGGGILQSLCCRGKFNNRKLRTNVISIIYGKNLSVSSLFSYEVKNYS